MGADKRGRSTPAWHGALAVAIGLGAATAGDPAGVEHTNELMAVAPDVASPSNGTEPGAAMPLFVRLRTAVGAEPPLIPATAATSTTATSTTRNQSAWEASGREALAFIAFPWEDRLDGWTLTFSPGREGVYGYTYVDRNEIEIFVRDGQPIALLAHVIAHELGHAVDVTHNSSGDRDRWSQARGLADVPWWPGEGANDFATGAGDFAEAFAAWQVGPSEFRSEVADMPTADQLALLAELSQG